jgi:hypothetical protein
MLAIALHLLAIPLGLLYANAGEWFIHKYVLHGVGKRKGSFWDFHWREHHSACRRHASPSACTPRARRRGASCWLR